MAHHLFGTVLTPHGIASNNRGESAGNVTTLQKVIKDDGLFTTVSAEAIRYAIREAFTEGGKVVNRRITSGGSDWRDPKFENWQAHLDDDLLGFMLPDKETVKRRGRLEISRALSTRPWPGDVVFNAAAVGAQSSGNPKRSSGNPNPMPYGTEIHATRYQYSFALTPETLEDRTRAIDALESIRDLRRVAGNHSRYLYDFSPDAVVLRWTHDPAPRLMYCFEQDELGTITADSLLSRVGSGDIDASEVVVGGPAALALRDRLTAAGIHFAEGVKDAFQEIEARLRLHLGL